MQREERQTLRVKVGQGKSSLIKVAVAEQIDRRTLDEVRRHRAQAIRVNPSESDSIRAMGGMSMGHIATWRRPADGSRRAKRSFAPRSVAECNLGTRSDEASRGGLRSWRMRRAPESENAARGAASPSSQGRSR